MLHIFMNNKEEIFLLRQKRSRSDKLECEFETRTQTCLKEKQRENYREAVSYIAGVSQNRIEKA
jgi:hypothetical protein